MAKISKTEKVSVTLPSKLIAEVRALVPQGEVSSFFSDAVEQFLAHRRQKAAMERGFGAWKSKNHPDLANPEDSTAYVRTLREVGKGRIARLGS